MMGRLPTRRKRIRMGLDITPRDVEEHMKRHPRAMKMLE
jgi:hypothetical protein